MPRSEPPVEAGRSGFVSLQAEHKVNRPDGFLGAGPFPAATQPVLVLMRQPRSRREPWSSHQWPRQPRSESAKCRQDRVLYCRSSRTGCRGSGK